MLHFFWKPYTSEITDFVATLRQRDPGLEARQREGRGLLWDRPQDREAAAGFQAACVAQPPYPYYQPPVK